MAPDVKRINPNGVAALAKDVRYLTDFVDTLGNPILGQNLEELQQTVSLMQAENSEEFYDVSIRNKKYGRVDAMNGPVLLEKYVRTLGLDALLVACTFDSLQAHPLYTKPREDRQVRHYFIPVWYQIIKTTRRIIKQRSKFRTRRV